MTSSQDAFSILDMSLTEVRRALVTATTENKSLRVLATVLAVAPSLDPKVRGEMLDAMANGDSSALAQAIGLVLAIAKNPDQQENSWRIRLEDELISELEEALG